MLEFIQAALSFTAKLQHRNGSFDEWYPNECSFVATAFVTAALSETLLLLPHNEIQDREKVLAMLARSARWLSKRQDEPVMNQVAGAALALLNVSILCSEKKYRDAAEAMLSSFLKKESPEGWWDEYGGPDGGYLSLTIDYLSRYQARSPRKDLGEALSRAEKFLVHFLHPDFTSGGEYLSRNTSYLIPSGFARRAHESAPARLLYSFAAEALRRNRGITPAGLDDRYLCYILSNWLAAGFIPSAEEPVERGLSARRLDVFFKEAGIRVLQNEHYYFVTNLKKGGSFYLCSSAGNYADAGIELSDRGVLSSQAATAHPLNDHASSGALGRIQEPLLTTPRMVIFKAYQWLLGGVLPLSGMIKKGLRKRLITGKSSGIPFERTFELKADSVVVTDRVKAAFSRENLRLGVSASYAFIPSAKFAAVRGSSRLMPKEEFRSSKNETVITRSFFLR